MDMESRNQFKEPPTPTAKPDQTNQYHMGFNNSSSDTQTLSTQKNNFTEKNPNRNSNQNNNVQTDGESCVNNPSKQSTKTPVNTRIARILPIPAQYFQEIRSQVTFNQQNNSENESQTQLRNQLNDAKILTSIYNKELYVEPQHVGTVYARINQCDSDDSTESTNSRTPNTGTTKDTTNSYTNNGSGENKTNGSGENSGETTNSGENLSGENNSGENVVINGQKYKFNSRYIHQARKNEDHLQKHGNYGQNYGQNYDLKFGDNDRLNYGQSYGQNYGRQYGQNYDGKNGSSNNESGNNESGNSNEKTKLFKMYIDRPDGRRLQKVMKAGKVMHKSSSGYKTNSKTNSGSKVHSNEEKNNENGNIKMNDSGNNDNVKPLQQMEHLDLITSEWIYDVKTGDYNKRIGQPIEINPFAALPPSSKKSSKTGSKTASKGKTSMTACSPTNKSNELKLNKKESDESAEVLKRHEVSSTTSPKVGESSEREGRSRIKIKKESNMKDCVKPEMIGPSKTGKIDVKILTRSSASSYEHEHITTKLKKSTSLQSMIQTTTSNKKSDKCTTSTDVASEINYIYGVLTQKCLATDKTDKIENNKSNITISESFTFGATDDREDFKLKRKKENIQETCSSGSGTGVRASGHDEVQFYAKSYRKNNKVTKTTECADKRREKRSRAENFFRGKQLLTNAFARDWSGSQIRNDGERPRDYCDAWVHNSNTMMSDLRDLGNLKQRARSDSNESPKSLESSHDLSQSSNSKQSSYDSENIFTSKSPTQVTNQAEVSAELEQSRVRAELKKSRSLGTSTHSLAPPGDPAASNPTATHNQNISSLASLCNRSEIMDTTEPVHVENNNDFYGHNILNVSNQDCLSRANGLITVKVTNYDGKITHQIMTEEEFARALRRVPAKPRSRSMESKPKPKQSPTGSGTSEKEYKSYVKTTSKKTSIGLKTGLRVGVLAIQEPDNRKQALEQYQFQQYKSKNAQIRERRLSFGQQTSDGKIEASNLQVEIETKNIFENPGINDEQKFVEIYQEIGNGFQIQDEDQTENNKNQDEEVQMHIVADSEVNENSMIVDSNEVVLDCSSVNQNVGGQVESIFQLAENIQNGYFENGKIPGRSRQQRRSLFELLTDVKNVNSENVPISMKNSQKTNYTFKSSQNPATQKSFQHSNDQIDTKHCFDNIHFRDRLDNQLNDQIHRIELTNKWNNRINGENDHLSHQIMNNFNETSTGSNSKTTQMKKLINANNKTSNNNVLYSNTFSSKKGFLSDIQSNAPPSMNVDLSGDLTDQQMKGQSMNYCDLLELRLKQAKQNELAIKHESLQRVISAENNLNKLAYAKNLLDQQQVQNFNRTNSHQLALSNCQIPEAQSSNTSNPHTPNNNLSDQISSEGMNADTFNNTYVNTRTGGANAFHMKRQGLQIQSSVNITSSDENSAHVTAAQLLTQQVQNKLLLQKSGIELKTLNQNMSQNLSQNASIFQNGGQNENRSINENRSQSFNKHRNKNPDQSSNHNFNQNSIQNLKQSSNQNLNQNFIQNVEKNLSQNLNQNFNQNLNQKLNQNFNLNLTKIFNHNSNMNFNQNFPNNSEQISSQNSNQNLIVNYSENKTPSQIQHAPFSKADLDKSQNRQHESILVTQLQSSLNLRNLVHHSSKQKDINSGLQFQKSIGQNIGIQSPVQRKSGLLISGLQNSVSINSALHESHNSALQNSIQKNAVLQQNISQGLSRLNNQSSPPNQQRSSTTSNQRNVSSNTNSQNKSVHKQTSRLNGGSPYQRMTIETRLKLAEKLNLPAQSIADSIEDVRKVFVEFNHFIKMMRWTIAFIAHEFDYSPTRMGEILKFQNIKNGKRKIPEWIKLSRRMLNIMNDNVIKQEYEQLFQSFQANKQTRTNTKQNNQQMLERSSSFIQPRTTNLMNLSKKMENNSDTRFIGQDRHFK